MKTTIIRGLKLWYKHIFDDVQLHCFVWLHIARECGENVKKKPFLSIHGRYLCALMGQQNIMLMQFRLNRRKVGNYKVTGAFYANKFWKGLKKHETTIIWILLETSEVSVPCPHWETCTIFFMVWRTLKTTILYQFTARDPIANPTSESMSYLSPRSDYVFRLNKQPFEIEFSWLTKM